LNIADVSSSKYALAYEWHNKKTGHCYVDYIPKNGMDEMNGYSKTPLHKTSLYDKAESVSIKFGRWLLKYATGIDSGNGLCYLYDGKEYNTDEIYKVFFEECIVG